MNCFLSQYIDNLEICLQLYRVVELFAVIEFTLTTFKTKPYENHTLLGHTSLLRSDNEVTPPPPNCVYMYLMSIRTYETSSFLFTSAKLFTLQRVRRLLNAM